MTAKGPTLPPKRGLSAPLVEVFASVQGEGGYLGEPQIFVRFARCPLRCLYCDTPGSWAVRKTYRVVEEGGSRHLRNPATSEEILRHCRRLESGAGRRLTVSLTGGEPLLYPEFIGELAPRLRGEGRRVHLETAGVHPAGLRRVLSQIDHVSMDWKIPSTLEKGDFRELQRRFLCEALGAPRRDLVVKIVLTPDVREEEFGKAIGEIAAIDRRAPVILQPATPARKVRRRVPPGKLRAFTRLALARLENVRVLPQLHPVLGLR